MVPAVAQRRWWSERWWEPKSESAAPPLGRLLERRSVLLRSRRCRARSANRSRSSGPPLDRRARPGTVQPARRAPSRDRKSTRLNSSHTEIYTLSLHDALPISSVSRAVRESVTLVGSTVGPKGEARDSPASAPSAVARSEEHTSELQSHRDLHSFPTRRSSDLVGVARGPRIGHARRVHRWTEGRGQGQSSQRAERRR